MLRVPRAATHPKTPDEQFRLRFPRRLEVPTRLSVGRNTRTNRPEFSYITGTRGATAVDLDRDKLLWIYRRMRQIREFENRLHDDFSAGLIPGFVHLYAGEEAIAVGVCAHLDDDDFITSTHRGHGHCIAKGVQINEMMAEIRGKASGCCKGKGGSMHIADLDRGMLGANGVVGSNVPVACWTSTSATTRET